MSRAVPVPVSFIDIRTGDLTTAGRTWCELVARRLLEHEDTFGGGSAPVDATYVTMSNNATLTHERVLTAGSNITITDGGANSTVTIAATGGASSPLTTKGDIWGYDTDDDRIPVGLDGQFLMANSAAALGVSWVNNDAAFVLALLRRRIWGLRASPQDTNFSSTVYSTQLGGAQFQATTPGGTTSPWTLSGDYYGTAAKVRWACNAGVDLGAGGYLRSPSTGFLMVRGNGSGAGGFDSNSICGFGAVNADSRYAIGVSNTGVLAQSLTELDPGTTDHRHFAIFGADSGDTNMQIMHCDGSGSSVTKIDLGAGWPRPTAQATIYWVRFYCEASASSLNYYVERLNDGVRTSGTLTTNLPGATEGLVHQMFVNTGPSTATAVSLDGLGMFGSAPY